MSELTKEEVKDDVAKYSILQSVADSEGGKLLKKTLISDLVYEITKLLSYRKLTLQEFITISAAIEVRWSLLLPLKNSKINKKDSEKELAKILQKELDAEENGNQI